MRKKKNRIFNEIKKLKFNDLTCKISNEISGFSTQKYFQINKNLFQNKKLKLLTLSMEHESVVAILGGFFKVFFLKNKRVSSWYVWYCFGYCCQLWKEKQGYSFHHRRGLRNFFLKKMTIALTLFLGRRYQQKSQKQQISPYHCFERECYSNNCSWRSCEECHIGSLLPSCASHPRCDRKE